MTMRNEAPKSAEFRAAEANPYAAPLECGDQAGPTTPEDDARERAWQFVERIHSRTKWLTINVGLVIGLALLCVGAAINQGSVTAIVDDGSVAVGSVVLGLFAAEVFLLRLFHIQSKAVASRRLNELATSFDAQSRCLRACAILIFIVAGCLCILAVA